MRKPLIAASVFGSVPRCIFLSNESKNGGADLIEIRFDLCSDTLTPELCMKIARNLSRRSRLRKIATFRIREEGGNPRLFNKRTNRASFYSAVFPYVDTIDVELEAGDKSEIISHARKARKKIIVSMHDLKKTPPEHELDDILKKGFSAGGDVVKVACFAKSSQEALRLLAFTLRNRKKPVITVSLGEKGIFTRVLAGVFGSRVLYGHVGKASFPHQLSVKQIADGLKVFDCR